MRTGTYIATEAADVVLMSGNLMGEPTAIAPSRATIGNIRQNLFWAFAYAGEIRTLDSEVTIGFLMIPFTGEL